MAQGKPAEPRESAWRCALRSQFRGEPLLGTAFTASRVLMIEQPGAWGRSGITQSDLDPSVARAVVDRAEAAGMRVQAIRQPGRTPGGARRRWMIADCRAGSESLRVGSFEDDAELLDLPLDGSTGALDTETLFLVCAHSKHDACCALRGRNVAAAMALERPGRVFECSHLGGDRLAANVLVLPAGLLYGRMLPFAAAEFMAAAEAGEVVPELLRGRVGLPPAAQAALAFGYEYLGLRRRADLDVVAVGELRDEAIDVELAGPDGALLVTVGVEAVDTTGLSCSKPGPGRYFVHRPIAIMARA